ncbi:MAG: TauD/TfdA family dioxygenase [Acidobacteriota bacterium]
MSVPFPDAARIQVSPSLARDLLRSAESLPSYDNKDFYSLDLQRELRDAVRSACGEGYDELIHKVKDRLARPPFCTLVGGLEFDRGNRLFVALNRGLGNLVAGPYEPPRAQLVHYIQPATDIEATSTGKKRRTESERFHTDTADWPEPVEVISMVCVSPDRQGGGRSLLLDEVTLRQEIEELLGRDAIDLLERETVPWQLADYLGGGVVRRPILGPAGVCWRRYTIDAALTTEGAALSQAMAGLLDQLSQSIDGSDRAVDVLMAESELLFIDNRRALHARTELSGDYRTSGRLMLRSWIQAAA